MKISQRSNDLIDQIVSEIVDSNTLLIGAGYMLDDADQELLSKIGSDDRAKAKVIQALKPKIKEWLQWQVSIEEEATSPLQVQAHLEEVRNQLLAH